MDKICHVGERDSEHLVVDVLEGLDALGVSLDVLPCFSELHVRLLALERPLRVVFGRACPGVEFLPSWTSWFLGRRAGDFGIVPSVPLQCFGISLALTVLGAVSGDLLTWSARRSIRTQAGLPLLRRGGGEGHRVL